jgi:hypothetical protein
VVPADIVAVATGRQQVGCDRSQFRVLLKAVDCPEDLRREPTRGFRISFLEVIVRRL